MLQILLLCLVAFHTSQATPVEKATAEEVLRTLDAIDDVLGWARAHYDSLILDFIFGLRIAQGKIFKLAEPVPQALNIIVVVSTKDPIPGTEQSDVAQNPFVQTFILHCKATCSPIFKVIGWNGLYRNYQIKNKYSHPPNTALPLTTSPQYCR